METNNAKIAMEQLCTVAKNVYICFLDPVLLFCLEMFIFFKLNILGLFPVVSMSLSTSHVNLLVYYYIVVAKYNELHL